MLCLGIPSTPRLETELNGSIGIFPGGLDPAGAFAVGTYDECAIRFREVLLRYGYGPGAGEIADALSQISDAASCADTAEYLEICDTANMLAELRGHGLRLGLVTADTQMAADYCVRRLGLNGLFDFTEGARAGIPAKPHRASIDRFCAKFGIKPSEVAVVGDSRADIKFARNAGAVSVGVMSGVCDAPGLLAEADYVIRHVGCLRQLLLREELKWEKLNCTA